MSPPASHEHERIVAELIRLLGPYADSAGLEMTGAVAIGDQQDYRVPDLALHHPGAASQWHPTCALAGEVLSPGDETWKKLDLYAAHHVQELLIVDPGRQTIEWLALTQDGSYQPTEQGQLLELSLHRLAQQLGWSAQPSS